MPTKNIWHTKPISEVLSSLRTGERGLHPNEVSRRLKKNGRNTLPEGKVDSLLIIFLHQFQSPLIYVLFIAGARGLSMV